MERNDERRPSPGPLAPGPGGGSDWEMRLRETMLAQRIVNLRGNLDEQLAGQLAMELMSLDASGDERITLYLDSGEGTLDAGFILIDVIDLLGVPVHVTVLGRAEGPAACVVAICDHRAASAHARFRLCEPVSEAFGHAHDMARFAEQQAAQLTRFVTRLAEATGRPNEHLEADLASGRYLDAREALEYGLIDEIWTPTRESAPGDRQPLGFRPPKRRHLSAYEDGSSGV